MDDLTSGNNLTEEAGSILKKHKIVREMESERIFTFDCYNGEIWLSEACDEYFGVKLNADICKQIATVFSELAECYGERRTDGR